MDFSITNNKPWLYQLDELKSEMFKQALAQTHGNRVEAAKLLGCSTKTILNQINEDEGLSHYKNNTGTFTYRNMAIQCLFQLGYRTEAISGMMGLSKPQVNFIIKQAFKNRKERIGLYRSKIVIDESIDTNAIIEESRLLVDKVLGKLQSGKLEEITAEEALYVRILQRNQFIDDQYMITAEGKEALCH
jgi:DNA-binding CsgD family transcriptional regulator